MKGFLNFKQGKIALKIDKSVKLHILSSQSYYE